jgi:hypothetical protein
MGQNRLLVVASSEFYASRAKNVRYWSLSGSAHPLVLALIKVSGTKNPIEVKNEVVLCSLFQ